VIGTDTVQITLFLLQIKWCIHKYCKLEILEL